MNIPAAKSDGLPLVHLRLDRDGAGGIEWMLESRRTSRAVAKDWILKRTESAEAARRTGPQSRSVTFNFPQ